MGFLTKSVLMLLVFPISAVWAQNNLLLLDHSGSMKAYYEQGVVQDLAGKITTVLRDHGSVDFAVFSSDVKPLPDLGLLGQQPWGAFTYLDRAIDHAIRKNYFIAWIITDNIQDQPNAPEAGNTEVFYQRLRGESVKRLTIFPILQPPGRGGLVVYSILLGGPAEDADSVYEKQVTGLLKSVTGRTEALRMKPLDRQTIDVNILRLNSNQKRKYREGEVVRESCEVRFKSRFDHLTIIDAQIETAKSQADFGPDSLLEPDKTQVQINPVKVEGLDPGGETKQIYKVDADLGKVRLKRNLRSIWKAAFGQSKEERSLHLSFTINVPEKDLRFKDQFVRDYNARSISSAKASGKIYGLENLPQLLSEETIRILANTEIPLQVTYPWWPAVLFIGLFLVVGAVVVAGVWHLAGPALALFERTDWRVRASTESGSPVPSEVTNDGEVIIQGNTVGEISGKRFRPDSGASLVDAEEETETLVLEEGLRIKLKVPFGGTLSVTFERAGESGEAEPFTPTRR